MFEKIVEAIGRFLSKLFGGFGDTFIDMKVNSSMAKNQAKAATLQAKSTLSISMSEESLVNYFSNRVVGEFLKILASVSPYKYEESSNSYVAYFVSRRNKNNIHYIKFSKKDLDDRDADVAFTYINKMISKTGLTSKLGNTKDNSLLVDDVVTSCVYNAISGTKAPMYLCHYIPGGNVDIGDGSFFIDTWMLTVKAINMDVEKYFRDSNCSEYKNVERLMTQAGMHLYMSYFKSTGNPFYRTSYLETETNTIVKAVKLYNQEQFNVNKIVSISFDKSSRISPVVKSVPGKNRFIIEAYGLSVTFTGSTSDDGVTAFQKFNYKLAESLAKSSNINLRRNFIFYVLSTGGTVSINGNEDSTQYNNDRVMTQYNANVEPYVKKVMDSANFVEDDNGDLASKDYTTFIEAEVKEKAKDKNPTIPEPSAPIISEKAPDIVISDYVDAISSSVDSMDNDAVGTNEIDKPIRSRVVTDGTNPELKSNSVIDSLKESSEKVVDSKVRKVEDESTYTGENYIKTLHDQADSVDSTTEGDDTKSDEVKYISKVNTKPIIKWTLEECKEALKGDYVFDTGFTKDDVKDRLIYLSLGG